MEEQIVVTSRPNLERIVMGRRLLKKSYPLTRVSSSFITSVEFVYKRGTDSGRLVIWMISGRAYDYMIPFDLWEGFYYAHSKGSYYNSYIKGQYRSSRVA